MGIGVVVLGAGVVVTVTPTGAVAAAKCAGTARSDFNGDGISDLAIGEPTSPGQGLGVVHVLYGTRTGLHAGATSTTPDDQLIASPVQADRVGFGTSLAPLDFNGDGCVDLAVGAPFAENPPAFRGSGFVSIFFGSSKGLTTTGALKIDARIAGTLNDSALFGETLAAGNFDGDKKQDLVITAPGEPVGASPADGRGAVYVLRGGASTGLRLIEGSNGLPHGDTSPADDAFGWSIATGDLNADGLSDLAIGIPGIHGNAGEVVIANGSKTSPPLTAANVGVWTQDTAVGSVGISGNAEEGDRFGSALATGDFNGDKRADLAVGVPGEALGPTVGAGMVNVIYSAGSKGLSVTGNQGWSQDSKGISNAAESNDLFGVSLTSGDFNGNGKADLAIGAYGEALGAENAAGMVNVLMGSAKGLSATGQQAWSQASAGIGDTPEENDFFGFSLGTVRTHAATRDDLVVGVINEAIGSIAGAGAVNVIPGSASGLTGKGSQFFNANTTGVQGTAGVDQNFGASVS